MTRIPDNENVTEYTDIIELQKEAPCLKEFTEDIVCNRTRGFTRVSIPQKIRYHSLDFEWGYGGSGPADLALNILYCFLDFNRAWKLHQMFKWAFIDIMPWEGGTIENEKIEAWIKEKLEE
ncbi:hypothetical protein ES702_03954 [subsurface metagenome]